MYVYKYNIYIYIYNNIYTYLDCWITLEYQMIWPGINQQVRTLFSCCFIIPKPWSPTECDLLSTEFSTSGTIAPLVAQKISGGKKIVIFWPTWNVRVNLGNKKPSQLCENRPTFVPLNQVIYLVLGKVLCIFFGLEMIPYLVSSHEMLRSKFSHVL